MTDPKEFNSLDELFRKTFEDLPDTPAPSGWDAPSPRVWDEVRVRLKPPRSGWSSQTLMLVSGLAVVLLLGLYWVLSRPDQAAEMPPAAETPAATATTPELRETTTIATPQSVETPAAQPKISAAPTRQTSRQEQKSAQPEIPVSPAPTNTTERQKEEHGRVRPSGSAPLPGSNPASPNTTVRRQAEAWRSAPWAKPLAPLPGVLETQIIRPVPEGLKELGKGGI